MKSKNFRAKKIGRFSQIATAGPKTNKSFQVKKSKNRISVPLQGAKIIVFFKNKKKGDGGVIDKEKD
ncbi:MAG: hypothetical protein GY739_17160 [Mesoflavibacter sp.]|nr:hypothetical protein [Mesoflavibacter sp.]